MTPEELQHLVLVASDVVTSPSQRLQWEATKLLNNWVSSTSSFDVSRVLIHVLKVSTEEVVIFYALTTLQRLDTIPSPNNERIELRNLLMVLSSSSSRWTTTRHGNNGNNNNNNNSSGGGGYLQTKVGVVLAKLILFDFDTTWTRWFEELSSSCLMKTTTSPMIYLRTLEALFEEESSGTRTRALKDQLRGFSVTGTILLPPNQTISARLLESLVELLKESYSSMMNNNNNNNNSSSTPNLSSSSAIQIATLTLTVMKNMTSWIDIGLLLDNNDDDDDTVLNLWFLGLNAHEDVGIVAMQCLQELVARGMEPKRKIELLVKTRVLERIHGVVNLETVDASPIDVVMEVAKFINLTGLELLPMWEEEATTTTTAVDNNNMISLLSHLKQQQLDQTLDLFFRCFAFDDIDVSGAVIPFASRLAQSKTLCCCYDTIPPNNTRKDDENENESCSSLYQYCFPQLMTILYKQLKYPQDFEYDYENEEDAEEEVYRTELRKLYTRLVRSNPILCLQFCCEVLSNLPIPISKSSTPDLEAALRLVFHYSEGIRPSSSSVAAAIIIKNETFRHVLIALHQSDVAQHEHREVLILYYDIVVRYHAIFFFFQKQQQHEQQQQEVSSSSSSELLLLPKVLEAMSGTRGIQHSHARVRSRSCYLLLRLVKSLSSPQQTTKNSLMRPYVETAVTGIQALLSSNSSTITNQQQDDDPFLQTDDTLYLFETIGILLGKTGLSPIQQQQSLTTIMTPHIQSIQELLHKTRTTTTTTTTGAAAGITTTTTQQQQLNNNNNTATAIGDCLSQSLSAITYLSKGFSRSIPKEVQIVLAETLDITLVTLETFPFHDLIRRNAIILFQRMILCLKSPEGKEKICRHVAPRFLFILVPHCTCTEDLVDVSQMFHQLCMKYKENAIPAIQDGLLPFLTKCHELLPRTTTTTTTNNNETTTTTTNAETFLFGGALPTATTTRDATIIPPHLLTEQLSIQKLMYTVLQHIATYHASGVLLSPTNAPSLENILQIMTHGAIHIKDASVKRTCLLFYRDLLKVWMMVTDEIMNDDTHNSDGNHHHDARRIQQGFVRYVGEHFLPEMLVQCFFFDSNNFDPITDANQARVVNDYASLLYSYKVGAAMTTTNGLMMAEAFENRFLAVLQSSRGGGYPHEQPIQHAAAAAISSSIGNGFRTASSQKEMLSCVQDWIKIWKQQQQQASSAHP